MNISSKIRVYEHNEVETDTDHLFVRSHWNSNRLVVLDFGSKKVTVSASDLKRAIDNATNHGL